VNGSITIAVDAMGGDRAPVMVLQGADIALERDPAARFLLFGDEARIGPLLKKLPRLAGAATVHHTPDIVLADAKPSVALRSGRRSSMRLAIDAVADGSADCVVSAGNTGALMAMAKIVLKTLPGIDRPAIAALFPTRRGESVMLDLGANIECDSENLVQFAVMGSALVTAVDGIERPTIGLLNIGEEDIKGNDVVKQTAELLKASPLNFYGNVEGDDLYKGTTDVVVCDGFVGNVALKVSEGLVVMLYDFLKTEFMRNPVRRLAALAAFPALRAFKKRVDPRRYNGATLVGLRGVVVKSHGGADVLGFRYALLKAYTEVANGVLDKIAHEIAAMPAAISPTAAVVAAEPHA